MASFYTTVSRIGQLAGGLDVAQKTKAKEIAAKNEQIRQFNLGLTKDYDIAKMDLAGKNQRNLNTNLTTLGSAKIRAGGKGNIDLGDFSNIDKLISDNIIGSGLLGKDYYDSDGNIKSDYLGSLSGLKNIIRDRIISSGAQNNLGQIQNIINESFSQLGPTINQDNGSLGFNQKVTDQVIGLKEKYNQSSDKSDFINRLRQKLMQDYQSTALVNRIIGIITSGN